MVALEELRRVDPELRDAFDARRWDGASRAGRGQGDSAAFRRQVRMNGQGEPGADPRANEAAADRRDGGARVAAYRAVWEELRAATDIAGPLLRDVPPEEMVAALVAAGQPPATVGADLYALLSWLRAVAAAAEHRAPAHGAGGAETPLLGQPFQIASGLPRHRRREPVEVVWRRSQRPE
jgi:hypothetical protein